MFGPPPDSPPPPDEELASPPGSPPDMDFPDADSIGGPPDEDFPGDDIGPPDDDTFGPPDDGSEFPAPDDGGGPDDGFGPDDDTMDFPPTDDSFGPPPDEDFPPPSDMDSVMFPPDDDMPPPSIGSAPPSPGGSVLGCPGDPPEMFPPPDDDSFPPPDSPGNTLPSDMPLPEDDSFPPDDDSLPSMPPPGTSPRGKPLRSSVASMDSLLSQGLDLKGSPQMRGKSDSKRSAKIGMLELGIGKLRRPDDGSVEEKDQSDSSTLRSDALESRPKVNRKGKGKPSKFKNSKGYDTDDNTISTDEQESVMKLDNVDYTSKRKNSIIIEGEEYFVLQGKFEGDNFEDLRVKVDRNIMSVKMAVDPNAIIPFDLLSDTKVMRDVHDQHKFRLKQFGSIITFKSESKDVIDSILRKVPQVALQDFDFNDSMENSRDEGSVEEKTPTDDQEGLIKSRGPFSSSLADFDIQDYDDYYDYEDGMMKRDELGGDGDFLTDKSNKKKDQRKPRATRVVGKSTLRDIRPPEDTIEGLGVRVKGYNRKELVDTHLQKPKFSIRRVKQLCKWIVSLHIWPRPVNIMTLHKELCNGLLLCRIMSSIVPDVKFMHLNERALTKKAALENLEQALGVVWRSKCVNNFRIPTSLDIYNGNTSKISILIQEVFEVYVLKPLYSQAPKMFSWFNVILKQYSTPLPDAIFTHGDLIGLWAHLQNGFCIFCVIYHLYGPVSIGEGLNMVRVDSLRIKKNTSNIKEYRDNISYVFSLLKALDIEILWDLDDWITYPDTEFIVLQLYFIYEKLKSRQCSLPPAQGTNAGVTSGPNGEPMVSGMVYADTHDAVDRVHKRCSVLLGSGEGALPVLPIDTSGDSAGYFRMVCPPGLLSNKVKIVHSSIEVKGRRAASERKNWNSSAVVDIVEERLSGSDQLATLKILNSGMINSERLPESVPSSESFNVDSMRERNALGASMEELEKAMLASDAELNSLEDDLASRYVELEGLSRSLGHVEYSSRLAYLEKERAMLEEERYKMQEHFSLRLKQIKEKHALVAGGFSTPRKSTVQTSPRSPAKSTSRSNKKKQDNKAMDEQLKQVERGWNRFVRRKDSHNYALGRGNVATSSTFMSASQMSKWDAGVDQSAISGSLKGYKSSRMKRGSAEESEMETMWNSFKVRLRSESIKWASSRSYGHNEKVRELMNTRNYEYMRGKVTNKIPVNVRPTEDHDSLQGNSEESIRANRIRQEELKLMQLEESRRYIVIQEKFSAYKTTPLPVPTDGSYDSPVRSPRARAVSSVRAAPAPTTPYNRPSPMFPATEPIQRASMMSSPVKPQQSRQASHGPMAVTAKNVDAVVSWMAFPRDIFLQDRHSQKNYTCVVENEHDAGKDSFALKWYEGAKTGVMASIDHNSALAGYVLLKDISSCQISPRDPAVLIIQIASGVRALKTSGGRSSLSLKFESDGECSKFLVGINTMQDL